MGRADGFVIVTPEHNHGMPGALKNLIDHVFDEWGQKPFGFTTTGGVSGGVHAQDQLRQTISGIRAVTIPTAVGVQQLDTTWEAGGPKGDRAVWDPRLDRFFSELE